jgi:amidase
MLDRDALRGTRIGVLGAFADPTDTDPEVLALFHAALDDLRRLGAKIVDSFEIDEMADRLREATFCRRFRYDMQLYLRSLGERAPILDVMEVLETGAYGPDAENALRFFGDGPLDVHPAEADPPCPDFAEHAGRQALLAAVIGAMDRAGIDAFVFPTWRYLPAPIDRANEEYRGDNSQGLIPAAGLPAISVPMGFSSGGLPVGLQIAARPFADGLLLQLAYAYEQGTLHRRPPPRFP